VVFDPFGYVASAMGSLAWGTLAHSSQRGFKPSAASSTITPEGPRIQYFPDVHDLASASDVLVVACALNKETPHIVNKDVLEALGKDGIVNLS
jgi:lactate dehydrogenase-like 2-hydroxyacid dehydrogenase